MKNKALLYAVESAENLDYAKDLVRRFLLLNEELGSVGKFDLFKYVAKNDFNPPIKGILHEDGRLIATNSHILVVVNREHPDELEGKIIDKNGLECSGKFPNWQSAIPNGGGELHDLPDAENYSELVRKYRLMKKQGLFKDVKTKAAFKLCNDMYFLMELFILFYEACTELGASQVDTYGVGRAIKAETEKGIALLMPVMYGDNLVVLN